MKKILSNIVFVIYCVLSIIIVPMCMLGDTMCGYTQNGSTFAWLSLVDYIFPDEKK